MHDHCSMERNMKMGSKINKPFKTILDTIPQENKPYINPIEHNKRGYPLFLDMPLYIKRPKLIFRT